jgi:hypothetical protein
VDRSRQAAPQPLVWGGVPRRNQHFTGRQELLDRLRERMANSGAGTAMPQVLYGPGEAGKTEIALEYVYRNAGDYDLVWWIPSEHPARIRRSLTNLARVLGRPDGSYAAALRALSSGEPHRNWLLVYDNAAHPHELRQLFPETITGKVIVTSRDPGWLGAGSIVEVEPTPTNRDLLFICYSHADSAVLSEIRVHLKALQRESLIRTWDDNQIRPGAKWRSELQRALAATRVALLLISPNFLASSIVMSEEIPALLKAAEDDGVTILCLILRPCLYERFPALNQFQAVNSPSRPLSALSRFQREQTLVRLATIIEESLASTLHLPRGPGVA